MAMLELAGGGWLELTPHGYQFPGSNWNDDDANWLLVEFAAKLGDKLRVSRRSAPCLLTWEVNSFLREARELLAGTLSTALLAGLEPCVAIDVTESVKDRLDVQLAVALEFAPIHREPFDEPFLATLSTTREAFAAFVERLASEMEPFPERKVEA